jgi:hypothetical protein
MEYVCVDTREGHGVLHMIWAWKDPNPAKRASFYIPFDWLQPSWKSIHCAFHVNIKRIGADDRDARRLSRYIVAQYCGGQNALVRLSQSKAAVPLAAMRAELKRALKGLPERFEFGEKLRESLGGAQYYPGTIQWVDGHKRRVPLPADTPPYKPSDFTRAFNQFFWIAFRQAWTELMRTRSCDVYGVKLVWANGELRRI